MVALTRDHPEDVTVSFTWSGPTMHSNGKLEVGYIGIRGLPIEVIVNHLPNLPTNEQRPLNFAVKDKNAIFATEVSSITITSYQLSKIQLVAGILQESAKLCPQALDNTMIVRNTSVEKEVGHHLHKPSNIEAGEHYNIICTVTGAKLVKCEAQRPKNPFQVYFEEFREAQKSLHPDTIGWRDQLEHITEALSEKLYKEKTLVELEQMLEQAQAFTITVEQAADYGAAVKILQECIVIIKEEHQESISMGEPNNNKLEAAQVPHLEKADESSEEQEVPNVPQPPKEKGNPCAIL